MRSYGFTLDFVPGGTISISGYPSRLAAREAVYKMAIRDGYSLGRLREKWWQFWRPTEYPEGYADALAEISVCAIDGDDGK